MSNAVSKRMCVFSASLSIGNITEYRVPIIVSDFLTVFSIKIKDNISGHPVTAGGHDRSSGPAPPLFTCLLTSCFCLFNNCRSRSQFITDLIPINSSLQNALFLISLFIIKRVVSLLLKRKKKGTENCKLRVFFETSFEVPTY